METLALKFLPRNKQLEYRYHFFFSSGKSELFETGYSNIQKTISASLFAPLKSVSLNSVMQFLGLHSSIRNSTTGTLPNCFLGWVSCSILCLSKCQVISEWKFDVFNFPKQQRKNFMNFCPRIQKLVKLEK